MKLFKRMAMTLAIVAACSAAVAQATEREVFRSPTHGIELVKPEGWHFQTIGELIGSMEDTKLKTEALRPIFHDSVRSILVTVAKYPEPYDGLNPSVTIHISPYGKLEAASPRELMNLGLAAYPLIFDDVVPEALRDVEMAGHPAVESRMTATAHKKSGTIMPMKSVSWLVPRDGYYVSISAGVRQDEANGTMEEVLAVLDTLQID